jgi:hypothetical protein
MWGEHGISQQPEDFVIFAENQLVLHLFRAAFHALDRSRARGFTNQQPD